MLSTYKTEKPLARRLRKRMPGAPAAAAIRT
jgi:hypothetical protein